MNKTIKISKELEIPLMDYATQATALMGIKGAGKSMSGGFLAEQLMTEGIPITALDPAGVWRYLKVPGRGDGFQVVVVGGEDSDFPLSEHTVEDITRAAMKEGVSLVIDLFTSRPSKNMIRQVVLKCVETMFYENKKHGVRHVFLEEAAEFAPQRIMADHARVYGAVEQLVRIGGNCSLGVTMINPRAENLNKDVLELCDFMFLHRQRGRNSLRNLDDWFEQSNMTPEEIDKVIATTMRLEAGQCWFMSKASEHPILVQMPLKRSFHPDRKNPQAEIKAVKRTVDVAAWVQKLKAALPKPEEKKPVAPKTSAPPASFAPKVVEVEKIVEVQVLSNEDRTQLSELTALLLDVQDRFAEIGKVSQHLDQILKRIPVGGIRPAPVRAALTPRTPSATRVAKVATNKEHDGELGTGGPRRMLIALAQRSPLTRQAICTRSQIAPGSFDTYFRRLTSNGWAEKSGNEISITADGAKALGEYEPLPTGKSLLDYYLNYLGDSGPRRMLEALTEYFPDEIGVEELCARAGIAVGSFDTYMRKLKTLELAEKNGHGVRASEELFE